MTPTISIVTPVFNGARYLARTMASVLSQTFQDWEYIVVDGQSADDTVAIARQVAATDVRVRVLSEPDRGMYDALFKGFAMARGDICCWINADDMLMPWAFATVVQYMGSKVTPVDWLTGVRSFWDADDLLTWVDVPLWRPRRLIRWGLHHGRGMGWIQQESTFFRRSLLDALEPAEVEQIRASRLAGDSLLWRAFARRASLRSIGTVISGFRRHSANASIDLERYYRELVAAGCIVPPSLVGRLAKGPFNVVAAVVGRHDAVRLRRGLDGA